MFLRDFIPAHTGEYSAFMLSLLFFCLAVYCCLGLREQKNRLSRVAQLLLSAVAMICSITVMVVLATHPELLGKHLVATILLFAASGVGISSSICLMIHAFMLMYLPLAWPRLVGTFAVFTASGHVFLTMLSYAVPPTSSLDGAIAIFETVSRDVTIVASLVAVVWFVVERGRRWRYVTVIMAWIEKKRPPTSHR